MWKALSSVLGRIMVIVIPAEVGKDPKDANPSTLFKYFETI